MHLGIFWSFFPRDVTCCIGDKSWWTRNRYEWLVSFRVSGLVFELGVQMQDRHFGGGSEGTHDAVEKPRLTHRFDET